MRHSLCILTVIAFILTMASSCKKDSEEALSPKPDPAQQQCDTTNITYSATVSPILSGRCYSCHSTAQATGGVILDTYAGVKQQVDNGRLLGAITHAPGYTPMPQGGPKLSNCDITKISKWANAGALNN